MITLVVDDEATCVAASDGAGRILGVERARLIGSRLGSLLEPRSRDLFDSFWRSLDEGGGHGGPFVLAAGRDTEPIEVAVGSSAASTCRLVIVHTATARDPLTAGGRGQSMAPTPVPTAREREILGLLTTGASDAQIASWLDLSPATVQTHVRNAKVKLGARTRAQAIALAVKRGLIQVD